MGIAELANKLDDRWVGKALKSEHFFRGYHYANTFETLQVINEVTVGKFCASTWDDGKKEIGFELESDLILFSLAIA